MWPPISACGFGEPLTGGNGMANEAHYPILNLDAIENLKLAARASAQMRSGRLSSASRRAPTFIEVDSKEPLKPKGQGSTIPTRPVVTVVSRSGQVFEA